MPLEIQNLVSLDQAAGAMNKAVHRKRRSFVPWKGTRKTIFFNRKYIFQLIFRHVSFSGSKFLGLKRSWVSHKKPSGPSVLWLFLELFTESFVKRWEWNPGLESFSGEKWSCQQQYKDVKDVNVNVNPDIRTSTESARFSPRNVGVKWTDLPGKIF